MLHTVVFIGRSGCGKGTQAALLNDYIAYHDPDKRQILYIETGNYVRDFIRQEGYSSKIAKDLYEKDHREPDFLGIFLWSKVMIDELDEGMHLVIDGAPRAIDEAQVLISALQFYKRENPTIIYLNVSRKWSEEKLLARGRSDDKTLAKINKRLDWFDQDVMPAVKYFETNPLCRFIEIDGEQTIEKVHADIIAVI
ncbi:MAG: hypothetical protein A3G05_02405 [Candidatus Zambryskibacteria bacterium RIFCSPLOWO2_12_FULL_45_14]|uniref:Adenylate kinase n=2 Tax=Candidatus Zambryskiibacteriota TaxID=1817925 RepID=A0A1G2UJV1_9BACT|nr:MAG: hypothetical protein A3H60_02365 [Candidatus Zambryskibacteria bacterium RIFCSPLOWO2_02_FULL_44_12b]OHB14561.1 MAG: hypothetical protein A3G05_02405 [Candidatus Zambryskibacteria bacterium RIFCSPLOWO2_12_FULL_45_14]